MEEKLAKKKIKATGTKRNVTPTLIITFIFLVAYSCVLLSMYAWGIMTSLKSSADYYKNKLNLPQSLEWENYTKALEMLKLRVTMWNGGNPKQVTVNAWGELQNSIYYAAGGAFITMATTWVVAYACSRFPNKFSKMVITVNIVFMTIPIMGRTPSALQVYRSLGLFDSWFQVAMSAITFVGVNLLIFTAFLDGIGKEYSEAALIDGASNLTIMLKVIFPLSAPMFFILYLQAFIVRWNDYMTMLVWMPGHPTIAYAVYRAGLTTGYAPGKIAACVILMLPILVLFICCNEKMMGNVRIGAMKG